MLVTVVLIFILSGALSSTSRYETDDQSIKCLKEDIQNTQECNDHHNTVFVDNKYTSNSNNHSPDSIETPTKPSEIMSRVIKQVVESREQDEGMGARVRRSIGNSKLRNLDPFLLLDEFRVQKPAGFPDHPHRGFETVSAHCHTYSRFTCICSSCEIVLFC